MANRPGSLFDDPGGAFAEEKITELMVSPCVRIERIVSNGQVSPPGFWYDQDWAEWVLVISGSADVQFEDETVPHTLKAGDYLSIARHRRHRVARTAVDEPTVWLAVHFIAE